jgi:subtilase family serine protease
MMVRLLLACTAVCLSCGVFAGQASAKAPPCADLYVENVYVSPTNPVQGMPATVVVTVHNGGTCAAGGFVTQFRTSLKSPTGPSESISGLLEPGESRTLYLPFVFTASGNYEAVIQVDTGNAVSETNEANNLEILPITVLPPGVNLVLEEFTVKPVASDPTESVVQGRPAVATIKVTNTGNVPAGTFVVQWTPYVLGKPLTKTVTGLAPGESTIVTMEYTFPTATTVTGKALADSTHAVTETDELDNSKTLATVVQPPLPNLRVVPGGIRTEAAPAGSTSNTEVEVENDGNNPAGAFIVTWKPGPLVAAQSQQVNGLAVGERTTVDFSNVYKSAGIYEGTVTVDSTHVISEVNEADNTAPTTLVVPAATVDLTITGMSIQPEDQGCGCDCNCNDVKPAYSASTIVQGETNIIHVTVKNLGNSPSPGFVTSWNPDADAIIVPGNQTLTQQTGPLGPGEERELTFVFTYPKAGHFRSIADVDAFKTVKETNEANNEKILNVTVEPAELELYFTSGIEFSPGSPATGEPATATFSIRNYGPIATEAFAVQFTPKEGGIKQTKLIKGLNVGEETTLTFPVTYTKAGSYTATAVIDPTNQIVKELTPDEESTTVNVQKKSAQLSLSLSSVEDLANPGGWQEWVVFVFGYEPHSAGCTIDFEISTPFSSKNFEKTIKEVNCDYTGETLKEPYFNPGEKRATGARVFLSLEEQTPLVGGTLALNICQGGCLDIGSPGTTTFVQPRASYLHPWSGEKKVEGKGCEEGKLNEGHCYNAFFELSLLSHVGSNAVKQASLAKSALATPSAETEPSEASGVSAVQAADAEVEALAAQAKAYEAETGAGKAKMSIKTTPAS